MKKRLFAYDELVLNCSYFVWMNEVNWRQVNGVLRWLSIDSLPIIVQKDESMVLGIMML